MIEFLFCIKKRKRVQWAVTGDTAEFGLIYRLGFKRNTP